MAQKHKFDVSWITLANFKRWRTQERAEWWRLTRLNYEDFIKPLLPTRVVVYDDVEAEWGLTKRQARAIIRMAR